MRWSNIKDGDRRQYKMFALWPLRAGSNARFSPVKPYGDTFWLETVVVVKRYFEGRPWVDDGWWIVEVRRPEEYHDQRS